MLRPSYPSVLRRRQPKRSGVTLLFVISFIVLFLLMGTTFIVVSTQFMSTSRQRTRLESDRTDRTTLLYKILYDILRGPDLDNQISPLRGQSLLADQYGYGAKAVVTSARPDPSGQFIVLQVRSLNTPTTGAVTDILTDQDMPLSLASGSYDGLVLSFTESPAGAAGRVKGISTRIVRYDIGPANQRFFVISGRWNDTTANPFANLASLLTDVVGAQVIINGREFNGSGAGQFNPSANKVTAALSPDALHPKQSGKIRAQLINDYLRTTNGTPASMFWRANPNPLTPSEYAQLGFVGGSPNESYDVADFQNMFLSNGGTIPSFHRPQLASYTRTNDPGNLARAMFRPYYDAADPNSTANIDFPGNDTNGDSLPDYWDVDNDGDGVRDSVWIDIGLPIQYDLSGRRYRPLVAVRIVDMDARFNLNAHGNILDAESSVGNYQLTPLGQLSNPPDPTLNTNMPRGQYLGPPEISLSPILTAAEYQVVVNGRYGADGVPGVAAVDPWASYKLFDYPGGMNLAGNIGSSFSTPLDIHGRFAHGYPLTAAFPAVLPGLDASASGLFADPRFVNESANSPYEMSFANRPFNSSSSSFDSPYLISEIEYFLRPFDKDANSLRSRLSESIASNALIQARDLITTDSYEVPTAPGHFSEFLFQNMIANGLTPPQARTQLTFMLSVDLSRGLRFDLNRPFGNGVDNSAPPNGVIDDPLENPLTEALTHPTPAVVQMEQTSSNRIAFARHLFVLGFMVARPNTKDLNGDMVVDAEDIRYLAQWVANMVDFRDADSINFGFEYDENPYNGWQVDGNLASDEGGDRQFVWGSERPELIFGGAIALHDRRTEDTDDERQGNNGMGMGQGARGTTTTHPGNPDEDFDNRLRPVGWGFIEVYNPWLTASNVDNQRLPAELYDNVGVDLDRATPNNGDPVWRILVVKDDDTGNGTDAMDLDPDHPDSTMRPGSSDVERSIYFLQPPQSYNQGGYGDGKQYFTDLAVRSIGTGQYGVIGGFSMYEADGTPGPLYRSTIGRLTTAIEGTAATLQLDDTRSIRLTPGAVAGVTMNKFNGAAMTGPVNYNASGIVINQVIQGGGPLARSFSFSEPVDGYPTVDVSTLGNPATSVIDGWEYQEAYDVPLDRDDTVQTDPDDRAAININGTTAKFRAIHLQRLANPLLDWNANTNPYLTLDRMYVDLVAFNGVIPQTEATNEEMFGVGSGNIQFSNVERGAAETGAATRRRILWRTEPATTTVNADTPVADGHHFNYQWEESLGRINVAYTTPYDNPTVFTNAPVTNSLVSFPWLNWNNRPFTSQLELANVPPFRNSQLLQTFSLANNAAQVYNGQPRFGHLPSLFGIFNTAGGPPGAGSDLHRLLEYIEVPSRFNGTQEYFTPVAGSTVLPPYDRLSRYRYPGKININTTQLLTWQGLMSTYTVAPQPVIGMNPITSRTSGFAAGLPTAIPSPFRVANSANHVPSIIGGNPNALVRWDVDTGPFRSRTPNAPTAIPNQPPAFDAVMGAATGNSHNDSTRSAYFRYDGRQRFGNNTTTRSSVFAIWITIGYFEVDNAGQIGAELGWDTGEVRRNRGFFVVDRSIPVAFEPGVNHNVDRAILIESFIE